MFKRFRSAVTGKFVTKGEAESTPDWTVSESGVNCGRLIKLANQVVNSASFDTHGRTQVSTKDLDALHDELRRIAS